MAVKKTCGKTCGKGLLRRSGLFLHGASLGFPQGFHLLTGFVDNSTLELFHLSTGPTSSIGLKEKSL